GEEHPADAVRVLADGVFFPELVGDAAQRRRAHDAARGRGAAVGLEPNHELARDRLWIGGRRRGARPGEPNLGREVVGAFRFGLDRVVELEPLQVGDAYGQPRIRRWPPDPRLPPECNGRIREHRGIEARPVPRPPELRALWTFPFQQTLLEGRRGLFRAPLVIGVAIGARHHRRPGGADRGDPRLVLPRG